MKYFVKYKEYTGRKAGIDKTRFFNTHDIENDWVMFKTLSPQPVELVDILPLLYDDNYG